MNSEKNIGEIFMGKEDKTEKRMAVHIFLGGTIGLAPGYGGYVFF